MKYCRKCQLPLNGNLVCIYCKSEYERINVKNHDNSTGITPRTYRHQIAYDILKKS